MTSSSHVDLALRYRLPHSFARRRPLDALPFLIMVAEDRPSRSESELERAAEYVTCEYSQIATGLDRLATSALAESHVEYG